jgi:putative transposase
VEVFSGLIERHEVRISMDRKGRISDNLFIEQLWRTVKYEEVYLKAYRDGRDAMVGIGDYSRFYDSKRPQRSWAT